MTVKGRILIVDDDPDFVKTTKMILLADGHEVTVAEDGRQGLDKIRESRPQLILLDIMMESIFEGFSFLSVLRTAPEFEDVKATPVLMGTAVGPSLDQHAYLLTPVPEPACGSMGVSQGPQARFRARRHASFNPSRCLSKFPY